MNIFLTQQEDKLRNDFFPKHVMDRLLALGNVKMNRYPRVMTEEELAEDLADIDICIVIAWGGCPKFTKEVLDKAENLKLIVTPGGSVASFITDSVYEREIKVCSANNIMAKYVAEGTLTYMLTALREVPKRNSQMKNGIWNSREGASLVNAKIGLVGMGAVGQHLLELLKPFGAEVKIFDPYIKKESLSKYDNVELCGLEEVLSENDVVSIHASKTDETYHMINKERLSLLKDGALLVNTARGALIDETALAEELKTGRISAVLDVFENEPLAEDNPFKDLENVILMPHTAGMVYIEKFSLAMLDEIKRFEAKEPLQNEILFEKYRLMTR